MDEAAARARLERLVAASDAPVLDDADLVELLVVARRPDPYGRVYGEAGYEETWDLRAAAAEGWRWKAARCVTHFDFSADGSSLSKSQVLAHCLQMAAEYGAASAGTFELVHPRRGLTEETLGNA